MRKEFILRYMKRVAVLGPFVAIFVFLPPGDLTAKLVGVGAFFFVLLFAQLMEVLFVARNMDRAARDEAARGPISVKRGSRRHYRYLVQKDEEHGKGP